MNPAYQSDFFSKVEFQKSSTNCRATRRYSTNFPVLAMSPFLILIQALACTVFLLIYFSISSSEFRSSSYRSAVCLIRSAISRCMLRVSALSVLLIHCRWPFRTKSRCSSCACRRSIFRDRTECGLMRLLGECICTG